ncbi:TonB-dependent receptor [Shewanella sp. WXL01]|uniref:TonB-dependent receptor domain-containing protein n=1 Tax=Shewanella sp. WXL01 TaxID=2709721 RepID=UPI0014382A09|nr:TonB-dependent receptor [Shewanella sp. WXL01]NKF49671.1 TonB-dependent receptor [Shewanella sp. WXL01]
MSSRPFSLTTVACAILALVNSPLAHSAEQQKEQVSRADVDVTQDMGAFQYRSTEMALAQSGVVVLPASSYQANTVVNRGAVNGVAQTQDGIFFSPAPYSADLVIAPNLFFQQSVNVEQSTTAGIGSEGSYGVVDYQSKRVSSADTATIVNLEAGQNSELAGGIIMSGTSKQYTMLLGVDYQKAEQDVGIARDLDAQYSHTDIMFKIGAGSLLGARNPQKTEFSFQFSDKDNDAGLLGLTDADFELEPQKRYQVAQFDNETQRRTRYALAHEVTLSPSNQMYTDLYYQSMSQKTSQMAYLNGDVIDKSLLAGLALFERQPLGVDLTLGAMAQDNEFDGFGIQTKGVNQYGQHKVIYHGRYHHDKAEMRLGYQDWIYGQDLSFTPGNSFSAVETYTDDATAILAGVDTELNYGKWQILAGVSYETVNVTREVSITSHDITNVDFSDDGWIPSLAAVYQGDSWRFEANAKRAWTAASAGNKLQKAQEAMQYELSAAYTLGAMHLDAATYYHDFNNMHFSCMWGVVCGYEGHTLQENIEDVKVYGADVSVNYQLAFDSFSMPIIANYLYAKTELDDSACANGSCPDTETRLPWTPEHQAFVSTGIVVGDFSLMAQALYQSEIGYMYDQVEDYLIDSQWKLNVAASYDFSAQHQVYLRVENALNQDLVAHNSHLGVVAGAEQKALLGYQGRF